MRAILLILALSTCQAAPIVTNLAPAALTPSVSEIDANVRFVQPIDAAPHYYAFSDFAVTSSLGGFSWALPFFSVQDQDFGGAYTFVVPVAHFAFNGTTGAETATVTMTEWDLGGNPVFDPVHALSSTVLTFTGEVSNDVAGGAQVRALAADPVVVPEPSSFGILLLGASLIYLRKETQCLKKHRSIPRIPRFDT